MLEMGLRLALGGVLIWAVLAKLASPAAAREGLGTMGFRSPAAQRAGLVLLVAVEGALAVGVLAGSTTLAWLGAALMALFALATSGAIAAGRSGEPCGCFGARSRVGWASVARNAALACAFAAVALLPASELSTDEWLGLGLAAALAGCAGLGLALAALAREVGMLRMRVGPSVALEVASEGPELGSRSEIVERIPGAAGAELALAVFTSDGCHVCEALGPAIESVAAHPAVAAARFDEHADAEEWSALDVPGSPFAVAFDPAGTVLAKGTFNNLAQLESILGAAERRARAGAVRG